MFANTPHRASRAGAGLAALAAATLILSGCVSTPADAPSTGADPLGVDDGTTLTMWSRSATETQSQAFVDAYNASHKNQVELTIIPNDDFVTKVGAAAGGGGLPDLISADIVFVPNWTSQGDRKSVV